MEENAKRPQVKIFYEKTPTYRTIYADGIIGGPTPTRAICLNFYATRAPIPKSVVHEIAPDGLVIGTGEISSDSKVGILREVELGVYMNRATAKEVYLFLQRILEQEEP